MLVLFGLHFDPVDVNNKFLRNVGSLSLDYIALYPRKYNSSDMWFFKLIIKTYSH